MDKNSLSHTKWECKYHIIFTPKYRRKIIYKQIRRAGRLGFNPTITGKNKAA